MPRDHSLELPKSLVIGLALGVILLVNVTLAVTLTLNIEHFGASPQAPASVNDTAIARAIADIPEGGATIIVPNWGYRISQPIVIAKNAMVMSGPSRPHKSRGSSAFSTRVAWLVSSMWSSRWSLGWFPHTCRHVACRRHTSRTAVSSFTPYAGCGWLR